MSSVRETALLLADEHLREDPGTCLVLWAPAAHEVRLVEVSTSVVNIISEVLAFRFCAIPPQVPFPCVLILLGTEEWRRVQAGELKLPPGFSEPLETLYRKPQ